MARVLMFLVSWLVVASVAEAQTFGTGTISGVVVDTADAVIPGATVVVTGPNFRQTAVADSEGRFAVEGLLQGSPATYAVSATLPGFDPVELRGIRASLGGDVSLKLTLRLGCLENLDYVILPAEDTFQQADAVLLLRVQSASESKKLTMTGRCGVAREYSAEVTEAFKNNLRSNSELLRFVHFDEDGVLNVGTDYLMFFWWDREVSRYRTLMPAWVLPVRGGIIECSEIVAGSLPCDSLPEAIETLHTLGGRR